MEVCLDPLALGAVPAVFLQGRADALHQHAGQVQGTQVRHLILTWYHNRKIKLLNLL